MTPLERETAMTRALLPNFIAPLTATLFAGFIAAILYAGVIGNTIAFLANNVLLATLIGSQIRRTARTSSRLLWLNPTVLASLISILIPFALTNICYFVDVEVTPDSFGGQFDLTDYSNHVMFIVIVGCSAMWLGYYSPIGSRLGAEIQRSTVAISLFRKKMKMRAGAVIGFIACSIVARLMQIRLGLFGFSGNFVENDFRWQFALGLLGSLGQISLVILALEYFRLDKKNPIVGLSLLGTVLLEVVFGLLSGFKSSAVAPLFVVAICFYAVKGTLPKRAIPLIVLSVLVAYAIVEPFRMLQTESRNSAGRGSIYALNSQLYDAIGTSSSVLESASSTAVAVAMRLNLTSMASLGIQYADDGYLGNESNRFRADILMSPVLAIVPRFLWADKTLNDSGNWFYTEVMGRVGNTSIAMSAFVFLYFAGGVFAVGLGFFAVGVVQRFLHDGLLSHGSGGLLVYLGLLTPLAIIDSSYSAFIIVLIQMVPILLAVQLILIKK